MDQFSAAEQKKLSEFRANLSFAQFVHHCRRDQQIGQSPVYDPEAVALAETRIEAINSERTNSPKLQETLKSLLRFSAKTMSL